MTTTTTISLCLAQVAPTAGFAQVVTENGSLLGADGSMLCDITVLTVCDPAVYAEQAKAIEDAMIAAGLLPPAPTEPLVEGELPAPTAPLAVEEVLEILPEPVPEPIPAPIPEPIPEPVPEPEVLLPLVEPVVEPVVEPLVEPLLEPLVEPLVEPVIEPILDPTLETPVEALVEEPLAPLDLPPVVDPDVLAPVEGVENLLVPEIAIEDPSAGLASNAAPVDPTLPIVETPLAAPEQLQGLTAVLGAEPKTAPVVSGETAPAATETTATPTAPADVPAPVAAATQATLAPAVTAGQEILPVTEQPPTATATSVVTEVITAQDVRSSNKEFAAAPVVTAPGQQTGLSDLQKVGLVALAALVVGSVINEGRKSERRVVSNTGDRVVILQPDGRYQVLKDDDMILRRPGDTVRTEGFADGSTRTIIGKPDGSQIVTIRDASGRVLRRAQYDKFGRERMLFDDFVPETPIVVSELPRPKKTRVTASAKDNSELGQALANLDKAPLTRRFSLRQIRDIPEVRALAPELDIERVTFESGSSVIRAAEAEQLADLGAEMQAMLQMNPGEVFQVEGHTDATGHAALNLTLSDRRAESVALALTEYFGIPAENMIVQGYGEAELLIDTQANERLNRRVAVKVITGLLNGG